MSKKFCKNKIKFHWYSNAFFTFLITYIEKYKYIQLLEKLGIVLMKNKFKNGHIFNFAILKRLLKEL